MKKSVQTDTLASAAISFAGQEIRIERLAAGENRPEAIRLLGWKKEHALPGPFVLTEKDFIELVHLAIHAGVLSHDFVGKLHERIEI